jgi:hypothetical protein
MKVPSKYRLRMEHDNPLHKFHRERMLKLYLSQSGRPIVSYHFIRMVENCLTYKYFGGRLLLALCLSCFKATVFDWVLMVVQFVCNSDVQKPHRLALIGITEKH